MSKQLNLFEKRIFDLWKKHTTSISEAHLEEARKEKLKIDNEYNARDILNSGMRHSAQIDLFLRTKRQIVKDCITEIKRLCLENNLSPSNSFRTQVENTLLSYHNKNHLSQFVDDLLRGDSPTAAQFKQQGQHKIEIEIRKTKLHCHILWEELGLKLQDKIKVFLSSAQDEFLHERNLLKFLIETDPVIGRLYQVFVFEADASPASEPPEEVYLEAVKNTDVYVGMFREQLRLAVKNEFEAAHNKQRLLFVDSQAKQNIELEAFLSAIKTDVTYYPFNGFADLKERIFAKLNEFYGEYKKNYSAGE